MANNKKDIDYLEVVKFDDADEFGKPLGNVRAAFTFAIDGWGGYFEVYVNRGRLGNQPFNCVGATEEEAKKIIRFHKKDPDSVGFEI